MDAQVFRFTFPDRSPERLDKYLVDCLPDFSRSRLQDLIRDGNVLVQGKTAKKTGQTLEAGMQVVVNLPATQPSSMRAEEIPLDIVFENEQLIVVNKPAGMVVHPSAGHHSGTLVNAALAHAPEMTGIGGEQRPGVVHRLDKDTSGLILLAKDDRTHRWLQDQFRLRKVKKVYMALVDGKPPTPMGRIEAPVGRDPSHRQKMAVVTDEKGREATSEYFTRETFPTHTLLEVHPHTGRTHQIRVHMAFLGCPVTGDRLYGLRKPSIKIDRQFLHAYQLTITLPDESTPRIFNAKLPEELESILRTLRK
jgi:23S rRNA pseudouridine1911/1915/1917 synthase